MRPGEKQEKRTNPIEPSSEKLTLRSHKLLVEVVRGPDAGRFAELPGVGAHIGASRDCDFSLSDPTVSRHHLELRIERERIRVMDLGSRNGTRIDGTEVRDGYARPDSLIALGDTVLRLRMLSDTIELPLSAREQFGQLLGGSIAMRRVFALLERVATTDTTVLVEGETGTGKELVAQGLHEEGPRGGKPFAIFDCSAVAPTLIESALFGHVRGAFTGAHVDRPGIFEEADGGTLFLDEVGELPLELQPKLLRALESREVRRLGAGSARRVDVRVVAATNRSLAREVDRGRFREDLYYRLAVITVRLPPLRERLEDIPLLARSFTEEFRARQSLPLPPLPDSMVKAFQSQAWPGNVRELRNAVDRALTLGAPAVASSPVPPLPPPPRAEDLGVSLDEPLLEGRRRIIDAYERYYIDMALRETGNNVSRAAALARVGRKFFQRTMKRLGRRGDSEE